MDEKSSTHSSEKRPWWWHPEVAAITLLVVGIHFSRLTALPVCGEEPRRALVAIEMMESGDWVVPRQQGHWYFSRPPLQNWIIASVGSVRGDVDTLAIRLPSALAILLTALLIYGYGRTFLSRFGAFAAAAVFATFGQVLQIGNLGETESVFTLLVSASLLAWHWGYVRSWPASWMWIAGGALAGLGALAKGLQAPAYFFAVTGVFLLIQRDWRRLIAWQPLAGIAAFFGVVGAWQIPYYLATDASAVRQIWTGLVQERLTLGGLVSHMAIHPLETLACLLPWSPLFLQFASRSFRASIKAQRPQVVFLVTALLVTYPSVWLAAGAVNRYYMPMYPCVALLIGLVIQGSVEAKPGSAAQRGWQRYLLGTALATAVGGAFVLAVSLIRSENLAAVAQPTMFAILFAVASIWTAVVLLRARAVGSVAAAGVAVAALAAFVGLSYTGAVLNARVAKSNDIAPVVAELKHKLPDPDNLVSFGRVFHLFRYHFRSPILQLNWPETPAQIPMGSDYFCFEAKLDGRGPAHDAEDRPALLRLNRELPFPWEKIAEVPCGRNRHEKVQPAVVVGRLTRPSTAVVQARRESKRR